MAGSFPQYSNVYPELVKLLKSRGGNTRPIQDGGVSGLSVWFRLVSSVAPSDDNVGLVLQTNGSLGGSFETHYGSNSKSGVVGYTFKGDPIQVSGRGLRPSPIISSVSVDESAEGGSRSATIKITAFTPQQADILSTYFLEPGFHLLCEWGWNTQKSVSQKCGGGKTITPCAIAEYDSWKTIKRKREQSGYTYDAVLGIVVSGGMNFGDNETYELEVRVTGVGNVAEYMQTHRDANKTDTAVKDSSNTFSSQQIDEAISSKYLGQALFMQMFNELPGQKRTNLVKSLKNDPKWADEANFVNMDKVVKETLTDAMAEGSELKTADATKDAKIPKDIPIITTDRYIRFELATEIINSYPIKLTPQQQVGCGKKSRDQRIQTNNTICSGFPHMFSTDKSKLYIPNSTAPSFNLLSALSATTEVTQFIVYNDLNNEANLANLHPLTGEKTYSESEYPNGSGKEFPKGPMRPIPYAFPSTYKLELKNEVDSSFKPIVEKEGFWGYLKNLYINFDFFVECISKPNFVIRDVYYEMLNGMSSACNSIWNFQIIETINKKTGALEVSVVDVNFSGKVSTEGITRFQSRGVDSPFVSCDFNLDTPGAMISSQVQKKLNSDIEHSPELNPRPMKGNVFSKYEDKVGTILQGLKTLQTEAEQKEAVKSGNNEAPPPKKSAKELEDEARALNYEYYAKTGAVLPKIQDRSGKLDITKTFFDSAKNDNTIESVLMVGAWNDSSALRQVFLIDKGLVTGAPAAQKIEENDRQNPPFGIGSFNFRVHGVSGFKVGDEFRVSGLPSKFGDPSFFQVVKIDHSVEGMSWWTDVKGELRIVGGKK
jgi:hypothetical protein